MLKRESLEKLALAYVQYLIRRDESIIKKYLSLNFMTRQKVTEQLRLISNLPDLLYGVDVEIRLFDEYVVNEDLNTMIIKPFQFEATYSPPTNLIEIEKITITIHSVVLEGAEWKIQSIVSDEEQRVLMNVIENLRTPVLAEI